MTVMLYIKGSLEGWQWFVYQHTHNILKSPEVAKRTDSGRLFQREGAQELNALAPVLVLILGTDRVIPLFDLSEHDGRQVAIKE